MKNYNIATLAASVLTGLLLVLPVLEVSAEEGRVDKVPQFFDELDNETCYRCHSDPSLKPKTERGKTLNLLVEKKEFSQTVHDSLACVDCHRGARSFEEAPHNGGEPLGFGCYFCHRAADREYQSSIHAQIDQKKLGKAPSCVDCHGGHRIFPVTDLRSEVNRYRLAEKCGSCHNAKKMDQYRKGNKAEPAMEYADSIHARALLISGLNVAPSCSDCHGSHYIQERTDSHSRIHKKNIPQTCGHCHFLIEQIYEKSIHGELLAKGDKRGPTCIHCHSSHQISVLSSLQSRGNIYKKCGNCHKEKLEQYRETIHGKAAALGRNDVAECSDCHGQHDMLPSSNPQSRIHENNRLATCLKCHPGASKNFSEYVVHAHHSDKKSSPHVYYVSRVMTILLIVLFTFFLLHSLLWAYRSFSTYLSNPQAQRAIRAQMSSDNVRFVRFSLFHRVIHALVIISFLVLITTGLPLKFYGSQWAEIILGILQGQRTAGIIHRVSALVLLGSSLLHLVSAFRTALRARMSRGKTSVPPSSWISGPDSMWPSREDVRHFFADLNWFVGRGERPQFNRFSYWEKLDYFTVFFSILVTGASGLIIWFPEVFTLFLPGWMINVAHVVHSDEALIIVAFIFVFHFFHSHFRLMKFPLDKSMWHGFVSSAELREQRREYLARLSERAEEEKDQSRPCEATMSKLLIFIVMVFFLLGFAGFLVGYWNIISRLVP